MWTGGTADHRKAKRCAEEPPGLQSSDSIREGLSPSRDKTGGGNRG